MEEERGRDPAAGERLEDGHPLEVVEEEEQEWWEFSGNVDIQSERDLPQTEVDFRNSISLLSVQELSSVTGDRRDGVYLRGHCCERNSPAQMPDGDW